MLRLLHVVVVEPAPRGTSGLPVSVPLFVMYPIVIDRTPTPVLLDTCTGGENVAPAAAVVGCWEKANETGTEHRGGTHETAIVAVPTLPPADAYMVAAPPMPTTKPVGSTVAAFGSLVLQVTFVGTEFPFASKGVAWSWTLIEPIGKVSIAVPGLTHTDATGPGATLKRSLVALVSAPDEATSV